MYGKKNRNRLNKITDAIGKMFKCSKTNEKFKVLGWAFDADIDEYKVVYFNIEDKKTKYTKKVEEFFTLNINVERTNLFSEVNKEQLNKILKNLGNRFKHFRTRDTYLIVDWIFDSDENKYKIVYHNIENKSVNFTRCVEDFFGIKNNVQRFEKI